MQIHVHRGIGYLFRFVQDGTNITSAHVFINDHVY